MMTNLTFKQLAFILDIKPVEALEKIIAIHCKIKGQELPSVRKSVTEYLFNFEPNKKGGQKKVRNNLPEALPLSILEEHLNVPLTSAVLDIKTNYLTRSATKKWILCDYPENVLRLATEKKPTLKLPGALESLLAGYVIDNIHEEWRKRYPNAIVK